MRAMLRDLEKPARLAPPSDKQIDYIKALCARVGKPYHRPGTTTSASQAIDRLKTLERQNAPQPTS